MEDSDESDRPISVGRQEIRKRKHPSQPMVDKSQQTEVTEKKKHTATLQSSGPKATLSISSIPGSKDTYFAKDCESSRVSSQLQKSWVKRKHGQEMADKFLQTDTIKKEKKLSLVDERTTPEEKPAGVGETASGLPESAQEVEIPPSRPLVQLKVDRSQQTTCTGDWTVMNIVQVEKLSKEQQTSFSALQIMVTKSKEGTQEQTFSGETLVTGHPEVQSATSSREEIRQSGIDKTSCSQETKKDTPVLLESEQVVTVPVVEEGSFSEKRVSAELEDSQIENVTGEVQPPTADEVPAELQPPPAEEAPAEVDPSLAEETSIPVQCTTEEILAAEVVTRVIQACIEAQSPLANELGSLQSTLGAQPLHVGSVHDDMRLSGTGLSEVRPAKIRFLVAEEDPVEVQPAVTEDAPGEVPVKIQPTMAEETTTEVQPSLPEETRAEEVFTEVQPPPSEEAHTEEFHTEFWHPPPEEAPTEEVPPEFQSPLTEEGHTEVISSEDLPELTGKASIEVQPPPTEEVPTEEAPTEVQPLPTEEALTEIVYTEVYLRPTEKASTEVQPPPTEETSTEEVPAEFQSPLTEEGHADVISSEDPPGLTEKASTEVQPPPTEETSTEEVPTDVQPPPVEEAPLEHFAKTQPPSTPIEEVLDKVQLLPADSVPEEESLREVQPPKAEKASAGIPSLSFEDIEELPEEDAQPEVLTLLTEEAPMKEISSGVHPPPVEEAPEEAITKEVSTGEIFFPTMFTQVSPAVPENSVAEESIVEPLPTESQSSQEPGISGKELGSVVLKGDAIFEGMVPGTEDLFDAKDKPVSTLKIEGVIEVKLKDS